MHRCSIARHQALLCRVLLCDSHRTKTPKKLHELTHCPCYIRRRKPEQRGNVHKPFGVRVEIDWKSTHNRHSRNRKKPIRWRPRSVTVALKNFHAHRNSAHFSPTILPPMLTVQYDTGCPIFLDFSRVSHLSLDIGFEGNLFPVWHHCDRKKWIGSIISDDYNGDAVYVSYSLSVSIPLVLEDCRQKSSREQALSSTMAYGACRSHSDCSLASELVNVQFLRWTCSSQRR